MNDIRLADRLFSVINERKCFIWGARHDGYAVKTAMERYGIKAAGYIDSSISLKGRTAFGLNVQTPKEFFAKYNNRNSFIIIASGFYVDEIAKECSKHGWLNYRDCIPYRDLRRFNYQVEVSGMCNLKCISCPRGNWERMRNTGIMSPASYKNILDKVLKEDPWTGIITLYNWGEPLLNPQLPEIIRITRENGLMSAVSSNLAVKKDFKDVIKEKPNWFRVSNSGWGENYEITHTGSNWNLFLENCNKLSEYIKKHSPETIVEFFFHIYSHNRNDYPKLKKLCDELGFILRYRHAALAPLDNIERVIKGGKLSEAAQKTRDLQFLNVDEVMDIAFRERNRPCYYLDHLWIDWDLSVPQCMEWYDPSLRLFENFLSVSLEEIQKARINSSHCKKCMEKGIHRAYCVYGDEKLILSKTSIPNLEEINNDNH